MVQLIPGSSPHDQVRSAASSAWTPRAPVRGTQSFVDTMSMVWRRPGLTLLEVAWRWAVAIPLLLLVAWQARRLWPVLPVDTSAWSSMTVFRPVEALQIVGATLRALLPLLLPVARWLVPLVFFVWTLGWVGGQSTVLRRLDSGLRPAYVPLLVLRVLRTLSLLALLLSWGAGLRWAAMRTVASVAEPSEEPNLVGFCALAICGSLLLYVGWAAVNWVVDAAPVLAMRERTGAFRAVSRAARLQRPRAKLIEINMVMSIVKIVLVVLALVFSACPLPFESVASESFLRNWWIAVGVFYCLASDYFHVVRSAAYLALLREGAADS